MPIVTLSHEIGAGGPEIGQKLAERLSLHCVDQELGTVYGVTRERIPQVEMMGLKKLSRGPLRERLASFIGG